MNRESGTMNRELGTAPLWRLARELRARPVAIEPRAFESIDRQLADAIAARVPWSGARPPSASIGPDGPSNGKTAKPPYELRDGVAVVRLAGVIGRHLSQLDMECGGCDIDRVADALREADADPAVLGIVLDVDSPGGAVGGVSECAWAVRGLSKPVVAYAADLCASAAYWVASAADELLVGPTCEIGSVGVYCAILDKSKLYDRAGLRVELLASGGNKAAGYPGTSLTDGQREVLQGQVDYIASLFKSAVLASRTIEPSLLDGRCLVGAQAVSAGFADETGTLADAIAAARGYGEITDER